MIFLAAWLWTFWNGCQKKEKLLMNAKFQTFLILTKFNILFYRNPFHFSLGVGAVSHWKCTPKVQVDRWPPLPLLRPNCILQGRSSIIQPVQSLHVAVYRSLRNQLLCEKLSHDVRIAIVWCSQLKSLWLEMDSDTNKPSPSSSSSCSPSASSNWSSLWWSEWKGLW